MWDNVRSAFVSIWSNKLRSLLTLLGVVIGVTSVITLVSLGQGLKNDVSGLVRGFGTNVLVVVAGKIDPKNPSSANSLNPADLISGDILTLADVKTIKSLPDIKQVTPLSLVGGGVKYGDKSLQKLTLLGADPNVLEAFQVLTIEKGKLFTSADQKAIVLSATAAQQLFGSSDPIGKMVTVGKDDLEVTGILEATKTDSVFSSGLTDVSLIPFNEATLLNKGQVKIVRIVAKAADTANVADVKAGMRQKLLVGRDQENFTVLTQDDILGLLDQFLNLSTAMVSAIAAISLIVGGIGIMNIMLVTVTERTREIGLRKAVGAPSSAILVQFLTEAVAITLVGGLIGLGLSYLAGLAVQWKTPLKPEFTWQVIGLTLALSVAIGVVFGLWPAVRAAKKDPIDALRYE